MFISIKYYAYLYVHEDVQNFKECAENFLICVHNILIHSYLFIHAHCNCGCVCGTNLYATHNVCTIHVNTHTGMIN